MTSLMRARTLALLLFGAISFSFFSAYHFLINSGHCILAEFNSVYVHEA